MSALREEMAQEQAQQIEEKAFSLCFNKVDELYQKKIESVIKNLKFLATPEVKDFMEFMINKKKVNIMKLINSHP